MAVILTTFDSASILHAASSNNPDPEYAISVDGNGIIEAMPAGSVDASEINQSAYQNLLAPFTANGWNFAPAANSSGFTFRLAPVFGEPVVNGARSVYFTKKEVDMLQVGVQIQAMAVDIRPNHHQVNFIQFWQSTSINKECGSGYHLDNTDDKCTPYHIVPFYIHPDKNYEQSYMNNDCYAGGFCTLGEKVAETLKNNGLFYDFHGRAYPQKSGDFIDWLATVFPVSVNNKSVIVHNGISWGFTVTSALQGGSQGIFQDHNGVCNSVGCVQVGTNQMQFGQWVVAPNGGLATNWLTFSGATLDPIVNTPFVLGTFSLTSSGGQTSNLGTVTLNPVYGVDQWPQAISTTALSGLTPPPLNVDVTSSTSADTPSVNILCATFSVPKSQSKIMLLFDIGVAASV